MRVLHAGIFEDHCLGGDIVFKKGLIANGAEHVEFNYRTIVRQSGAEEMNKRLVAAAEGHDLLFIGKGELIRPETLRAVRARGCKVAIWYGDIRPEPEEWLLANLHECDVLFMSSAGEILEQHFRLGRPKIAAFYLNPCDPDLPAEFADVPRSVDPPLFTGMYHPVIGGVRREIMKYLGWRWDVQMVGCPRYFCGNRILARLAGKFFPQRYLRGREYIEAIIRCRFGIGVSARSDVLYYTSDRLTHYLTFGKLYLAHLFRGAETLFQDGKHIAYYRDVKDLARKISYYKKNREEAEAIGRAGQELVMREYNTARMTRMMLDIVERGESQVYPWVTVLA